MRTSETLQNNLTFPIGCLSIVVVVVVKHLSKLRIILFSDTTAILLAKICVCGI